MARDDSTPKASSTKFSASKAQLKTIGQCLNQAFAIKPPKLKASILSPYGISTQTSSDAMESTDQHPQAKLNALQTRLESLVSFVENPTKLLKLVLSNPAYVQAGTNHQDWHVKGEVESINFGTGPLSRLMKAIVRRIGSYTKSRNVDRRKGVFSWWRSGSKLDAISLIMLLCQELAVEISLQGSDPVSLTYANHLRSILQSFVSKIKSNLVELFGKAGHKNEGQSKLKTFQDIAKLLEQVEKIIQEASKPALQKTIQALIEKAEDYLEDTFSSFMHMLPNQKLELDSDDIFDYALISGSKSHLHGFQKTDFGKLLSSMLSTSAFSHLFGYKPSQDLQEDNPFIKVISGLGASSKPVMIEVREANIVSYKKATGICAEVISNYPKGQDMWKDLFEITGLLVEFAKICKKLESLDSGVRLFGELNFMNFEEFREYILTLHDIFQFVINEIHSRFEKFTGNIQSIENTDLIQTSKNIEWVQNFATAKDIFTNKVKATKQFFDALLGELKLFAEQNDISETMRNKARELMTEFLVNGKIAAQNYLGRSIIVEKHKQDLQEGARILFLRVLEANLSPVIRAAFSSKSPRGLFDRVLFGKLTISDLTYLQNSNVIKTVNSSKNTYADLVFLYRLQVKIKLMQALNSQSQKDNLSTQALAKISKIIENDPIIKSLKAKVIKELKGSGLTAKNVFLQLMMATYFLPGSGLAKQIQDFLLLQAKNIKSELDASSGKLVEFSSEYNKKYALYSSFYLVIELANFAGGDFSLQAFFSSEYKRNFQRGHEGLVDAFRVLGTIDELGKFPEMYVSLLVKATRVDRNDEIEDHLLNGKGPRDESTPGLRSLQGELAKNSQVLEKVQAGQDDQQVEQSLSDSVIATRIAVFLTSIAMRLPSSSTKTKAQLMNLSSFCLELVVVLGQKASAQELSTSQKTKASELYGLLSTQPSWSSQLQTQIPGVSRFFKKYSGGDLHEVSFDIQGDQTMSVSKGVH